MTSNTIKKPQSRGAWRESRAHLLGVAFIRGESRRCRGSKEPLRRLPDGALATRRILVWCCCGTRRSRAARVRRARRFVRARLTKKACSSP